MPKSINDFKVRGGPAKRDAKITKLREFRETSAAWRKDFEKYWKRDHEDLEGYVDNSDAKKFPYRSRLRIPWPLYMTNAWVDNEAPIILDDDHPIELGPGRRGVPEGAVRTRQSLVDYFLYKTGFQWKLENLLRSEVGSGTGIWQAVRHAGTAMRDVAVPVIEQSTQQVVGTEIETQAVHVPYYGPGIEEVSLWDFYPDPGAKYMDTCPRAVRRFIMTKEEIQRRWPETLRIPDKSEKGSNDVSWERMARSAPSDDYRTQYDTYSQLNHAAPGETGMGSGVRYTVDVMWDVEEDEIIVTVGDSYLLDYRSLEMGDKKLPFVKTTYLPWGGTGGDYFYGKSLPSVIHALSKAAECLLNMGIDELKWANHPALIVSRMAQANLDSIRRGEPGAIIEVMGNPGMVQQLQKVAQTGNAMAEVGFIFQMIQMASNVNNYVTGNNAEGFNRTATGVVTLSQRAQSGFLQHAKRLSSVCLEPLGEKFDQAACVMLDKPDVIAIVGADGEFFEDEITYEDLTADVKIRPKRLRDHSERAMEAQMWQSFIQAGGLQLPGIDPQEVLLRFFTALGQRHIEKLLPQQLQMMMQARAPVPPAQSLSEVMAEHRQLKERGFIKPVTPDEDDEAHMALHREFMRGGDYQRLGPDAQEHMEMHLLSHEQYRVNETMINQMLQAQQQLPAGAAPAAQPAPIGADVLQAASQQMAGSGGSAPATRQPGLRPESVGSPTASAFRGSVV